jgi:endonuclease V-like protein UPF0215 family
VNPEHLFIGTQKDNMQDCIAKGRNPAKLYPELFRRVMLVSREKGNFRRHAAKLTEDQVIEIIKSAPKGRAAERIVAAKYGVTFDTIRLIVRGKTWTYGRPEEVRKCLTV